MKEHIISTANRDLSLDAAKGLLILMVVYAHCFTEGIVHDFFFAFHMPAFFVISGLTGAISKETERPLADTVWKLLRTIGVPYVFFELLGIVQELIRNGSSQSWKGFLFNIITLRCNNIVDWFLGTLLLAKLLSVLLCKGFRKALKRKTADTVYLLAAVAGLIAAILFSRTVPFLFVVIRRTLIAHAFFAIGLVWEPFIRKRALPLALASLSAAFALSLLNTEFVNLNDMQLGIPAVFLAAALLGAYGVIQLGKICEWKPLVWLGQNSLIIMGTHIPILLLARFASGSTAPTLLHRIGDFALILLLEIPIVWVLQNKAPFLLGKKEKAGHES